MSFAFQPEEILSLAIRLEENGVAFYRQAARLVLDPEVSRLLASLAEWEEGHRTRFTLLRQDLEDVPGALRVAPGSGLDAFLKAIVDVRGLGVAPKDTGGLTGEEDATGILRLAIRSEEEAILFYLGIQAGLEGRAAEQVGAIVREEMDHLGQLHKTLQNLECGAPRVE